MSRVENRKRNKKIKKTIYFPIFWGIIIAIFLLFVVDYRINSVMGLKKIRIVNIDLMDKKIVTLNALGYDLANINLTYIKNDISDMKRQAGSIKNNLEKSIREAMNQE